MVWAPESIYACKWVEYDRQDEVSPKYKINVGLLLTVTGVLTTCAVVSSESRWVVSRQLMVLNSSYWPHWSILLSGSVKFHLYVVLTYMASNRLMNGFSTAKTTIEEST